jgi:hypothetical protein
MLPTTIEVLKAGLRADPTVTPKDRARLMASLRSGGETNPSPAPASDAPPRLLRRADVARRLACCLRVVDRLAADGKLKRIKLPGRSRSAGFLESDVNELLMGRELA